MRVIVTEERPMLRGIPDVIALFLLVPLAGWLVYSAQPDIRGVAVLYSICLVMLFGVSAAYHSVTWGPRGLFWWKRADHSMIYVFIAACYTAPAVRVLEPHQATPVLIFVWVGALLGALKSIFWHRAPRALTVAIYLMLGWSIVPYWETVLAKMTALSLAFFVAGGLLYSVGAIVYGTRRPNPWPRVFGYHEVMHLFIIAAALAQLVAEWPIFTSPDGPPY